MIVNRHFHLGVCVALMRSIVITAGCYSGTYGCADGAANDCTLAISQLIADHGPDGSASSGRNGGSGFIVSECGPA